MILTTPRGRPASARISAKQRALRQVWGAGFDDDGVAGGEGGGDLPGQHEEGKIPGDDLADDAQRLVFGEGVREELGPAGVVVEMADGERDIQVARFANGFAVIERFEDGEQAGVFLQGTGDGVEVAGAPIGGESGPGGLGGLSGGDGRVDGFGIGIDTVGEQGAAAGAVGGEEYWRLRGSAIRRR